MNPSINWHRDKDPARRQQAERCVRTAKNLLLAGKTESCWHKVFEALGFNRCAPGANALLVAVTALRATNDRNLLPSGAPEPYSVFGLDPTIPTARDPAVIESYYRQASNLLDHCHPNDPCSPAFTKAARLVHDAWAFLSDPNRKASHDSKFKGLDPRFREFDSGFEAATTATASVPTAPSQTVPQQNSSLSSGPDGMGRSKRSRKFVPPAQDGLDDMGRGKRQKKPSKRMSL